MQDVDITSPNTDTDNAAPDNTESPTDTDSVAVDLTQKTEAAGTTKMSKQCAASTAQHVEVCALYTWFM